MAQQPVTTQRVHTRLWLEESEPDNPFATRAAYCGGYDVYGEMLGRARWVDMLYLLLRGEAPTPSQASLLETLAVALANAGPRDAAVHAAMCGGVGGSTAASCLMAALAVGAGQLNGGREIVLAMQRWAACGTDREAWRSALIAAPQDIASIWPTPEHAPGFDPHGIAMATIVRRTLERLAGIDGAVHLRWLQAERAALEAAAGAPLAMSGVAAAAFIDLALSPAQGEMLYLLLRLPGAAAHALEQRDYGHKNFPFFAIELDEGETETAA
jgi:citrate synthase